MLCSRLFQTPLVLRLCLRQEVDDHAFNVGGDFATWVTWEP